MLSLACARPAMHDPRIVFRQSHDAHSSRANAPGMPSCEEDQALVFNQLPMRLLWDCSQSRQGVDPCRNITIEIKSKQRDVDRSDVE